MSNISENIYNEIRSTVTKFLKIYHAYKLFNDIDDILSKEMNELVMSCKKATDKYNEINRQDPVKLHPYAAHINSLVKLTPALHLCIQDHNELVQERMAILDKLTESLRKIEELMKRGFVTVSMPELEEYHETEKKTLEKLRESLPMIENQHNMMRRRFETIRKELSKYDSPV